MCGLILLLLVILRVILFKISSRYLDRRPAYVASLSCSH